MIQPKSEEELAHLASQFEQNRKLVIPAIFVEPEIRKIHQFLTRLLPAYWVCATCVKKDRMELPLHDKRNALRIKKAYEAFSRGEFAYHFYRTFNANPSQYSVVEYSVRTYMASPEFIGYLNRITRLQLTQLNTLFVSKYTSNCFLSTHNDAGNGKVAFVLHLTEDWKPQYGGHLHFLDASRTHIVETYTPQFNSLMLFEIPEGDEGIPHFVGHVASHVQVPRIAITGWYQ